MPVLLMFSVNTGVVGTVRHSKSLIVKINKSGKAEKERTPRKDGKGVHIQPKLCISGKGEPRKRVNAYT